MLEKDVEIINNVVIMTHARRVVNLTPRAVVAARARENSTNKPVLLPSLTVATTPPQREKDRARSAR